MTRSESGEVTLAGPAPVVAAAPAPRRASQLVVALRLVALASAASFALWHREVGALQALGALSVIWLIGQIGVGRPGVSTAALVGVEALTTGVLAAVALSTEHAALTVLVVLPVIGALHLGWRGAVLTLAAQGVGLVAVILLLVGVPGPAAGLAAAAGTLAGAVLAAVAVTARARRTRGAADLAPYLRAQELLRELGDLDGSLPAALDVEALTTSILDAVASSLPIEHVALLAPSQGTLGPLASRSGERTVDAGSLAVRCERLAHSAWTRHDVVVETGAFAWPLAESTVVAGVLDAALAPRGPALEAALEGLERDLEARAVQLDTALLLTAFRSGQADDERRRLARELHDGLGQDLTAAGYLVDAIAEHPSSPDLPEQVATLRERISTAIREVRSVVTGLRTGPENAASLGAAIDAAVGHLAESTAVPIMVTLDEGPVRLPRESEAELLRITQEAVSNAVRHAGASVIDVLCQVRAPRARIVVSDDGAGLKPGRADSHGLEIMRERAARIGAELSVEDRDSGGVEVVVSLATGHRDADGPGEADVSDAAPTTAEGRATGPARAPRSARSPQTRKTQRQGTVGPSATTTQPATTSESTPGTTT